MRASLFLVFGGAVTALAASSLLLAQPQSAPQQSAPSVNPPPAGTSNVQVERGRYLVQLGDCVACHTDKGGARFAGGRRVETPFGTLLSANITPDQDTGIGRYTPDTFYRALHEGIDRDGRHLYPAFPYNYYTQVTREDSDAMFAYLRTIPVVRHEVHRNQLPFPFNIRELMVVWNAMFLDKGPFKPDAGKPEQWNRGAYLVEGLGHCEACHTPRNFLGSAKHDEAFRGGIFAEWFAPDITANQRIGLGAWKDDELREFLKRGVNAHSAAAGEMGEVVGFSTSQMNDADSAAMLAYLRGIAASPDRKTEAPDAKVMKQGEAIWQDQCAACHRMDGSGVPRYFPPMKHDLNAQQSDPTTLIHYVLAGARKVPTDGAPTPLSMPAFHWKLSDAQVAAVLTYLRNSWDNAAAPVKAEQVADIRKKLNLKAQPRGNAPPTDLAHAGPQTLGVANTDSRANGTPQAGQSAPANLRIDTAATRKGATQQAGGSGTESSGGSNAPKEKGGGHPAGVPTTGPG
jgi:mono/diheme cytochrome c family protein